jgi:hypothetical protein
LWWGDDIEVDVAERLGIDIGDVLETTSAEDRRRIAGAMRGHVYTKRRRKKPRNVLDKEWVSTPVDRSSRLFSCGHLRPAIRGGTEYGLAHWWCKDRLCPSCAAHRARDMGGALRAWIEHRQAPVLFGTLTQPKFPRSRETATEAIDRLLAAWRRMSNKKNASGRLFHAHFVGGARAIELAWAQSGDQHGKHKVVRSGWHAHIHALFEVREGVDPGEAAGVLQRLWLDASAGATPGAQCVVPVDDQRVGQVTKYPLKLPELDTPDVIREAAKALADRRVVLGFGDWRACLGKGRELRDADAETRKPILLADQKLTTMIRRGGVVSFTMRCGRQWATTTRPVADVRRALLADPTTFAQRDRELRHLRELLETENAERKARGLQPIRDIQREPRPIDDERRRWWQQWAPDDAVVIQLPRPRPPPEPEQMEILLC